MINRNIQWMRLGVCTFINKILMHFLRLSVCIEIEKSCKNFNYRLGIVEYFQKYTD